MTVSDNISSGVISYIRSIFYHLKIQIVRKKVQNKHIRVGLASFSQQPIFDWQRVKFGYGSIYDARLGFQCSNTYQTI